MITSRSNPWFRRFRDALKQHDREIVLEGPKAVHDAMRAGWKPIAVATSRADVSLPRSIHTIELDRKLFAAISDTVTAQGVVALFERPDAPLERIFEKPGVAVVLDEVQDPGNVGTVIRLAAAFEASGVALIEGSADPFGPKAIRASAGAVLTVPICPCTRRHVLEAVERYRYRLFAAAPGNHEVRLPTEKIAIAFGNEGQGVSAELSRRAEPVSIPMSDRVESLNVAAAAAILLARLYEARRGGTFHAERS